MNEQFFSDAITDITIAAGTVRLDFATLSATEKEGASPKLVFSHRTVMSIEGFMRATGKIQETIQTLHRLGIIQARPADAKPPESRQSRDELAQNSTDQNGSVPQKPKEVFP